MATRTLTLGKFKITLDEKDADIVEAHVEGVATARDAAVKRATDAEGALAAQGEAMKKLAADHKLALDAAESKAVKPEQVQALVTELSAVARDAGKLLPEFVTDGKSAMDIRIGVLSEVIAKDETLKVLATKLLRGSDPTKANDVLVTAAFDAVIAVGGGVSVGGGRGTEYERIVKDALGGGDERRTTTTQKLSGRALMIARSRGQVAQANRQ